MIDDPSPTDTERYPNLTDHGRRMLDYLREHPHAPIYRNQSGHRLTAADLAHVREYERRVLDEPFTWDPTRRPDWLPGFVDRCYRQVLRFRGLGSPPDDLGDLPTCSRADLSRDVTRFVPDDVSVERLINFQTSGTTGHPLLLPSLPRVAASYLAFHKRALRRLGITLRHGRGEVGVVLVGWQRKCFTYVSVTPTQDESGLAKINLHPDDWRDPDDRAPYLDDLAPEIYAGDPISFAVLADLPLALTDGTRPRALLSTSMDLSDGLRNRLETRFGCPVLDLYSLNEAGPVAVYDAELDGHVLLQPGMFVEILDPEGRLAPPGERGEVTLTGGFNDCLPLVRYRTGDHASLRQVRSDLVLFELDGRPPVRFRTADGTWINNIEVTHALKRHDLVQWTLHQGSDASLRLHLVGRHAGRPVVEKALRELFGDLTLQIEEDADLKDAADGKVVQYTSDLEGSAP